MHIDPMFCPSSTLHDLHAKIWHRSTYVHLHPRRWSGDQPQNLNGALCFSSSKGPLSEAKEGCRVRWLVSSTFGVFVWFFLLSCGCSLTLMDFDEFYESLCIQNTLSRSQSLRVTGGFQGPSEGQAEAIESQWVVSAGTLGTFLCTYRFTNEQWPLTPCWLRIIGGLINYWRLSWSIMMEGFEHRSNDDDHYFTQTPSQPAIGPARITVFHQIPIFCTLRQAIEIMHINAPNVSGQRMGWSPTCRSEMRGPHCRGPTNIFGIIINGLLTKSFFFFVLIT